MAPFPEDPTSAASRPETQGDLTPPPFAGAGALMTSRDLVAGEEFTIATWNVFSARAGLWTIASQFHGALGLADVVCLQEARRGTHSLTQRLARDFGYPWHFQVGSDAILSRFPIVASGKVHINRIVGRRAPWVTLLLNRPNETLLRVYSVHLSYKRGLWPFVKSVRWAEARRIERHLRKPASTFTGPTVIAGDFNSVGWVIGGWGTEPSLRVMRTLGFRDAIERNRRTHLLGRLDWILARGLDIGTPSIGNFSGSDHRWLLSRLRLPHSAV
jgi:endonuclease/exonuclease/phosphatase (EEP) superfamily protein YafD